MTFWTDERIGILRRGRAEHLSFALIAEQLGTTRNAAIGKALRLGISNGRPPNRTVAAAQHRLVNKRPRRKLGPQPRFHPPPSTPAPLLGDDEIPLAQRKTLLELDNKHCRWPCGDPRTPEFFYCGGEADLAVGLPYCAMHRQRAWRPCNSSA